jgi:hypothetical protein
MPHAPLKTPILFIVFNRPDTTQIVFNAIRNIRPLRLYVSADGPRPSVASDADRCAKTRKIIEQIDWECDVKTFFRDRNLGCGLGPSTAMNWFFEKEAEGIILEDDCLPSNSFFWFCEDLLERYRNDDRIMHIGGNNFLDSWSNNSEYSYYFSRSGHIWGWATWRRAWKLFDYNMSMYETVKQKGHFDEFFLNWLEKFYRLRKFNATVAKRGNIDWWDYQWDFARFINSGLAIVPSKNLVKNIGFGTDATHTTDKNSKSAGLDSNDIDFPIKHPPFVIRDLEADKKYFSKLIREIALSKLHL